MWNLGSLAHYPTCKMITFQASIFSTRSLGRFWSGPTILVFFIWSPMMKFDICGATKQKQWLGCFWTFGFFPIFSLYTYWTMYSVNFKSFRLKMTSESLISRYVVQNTTFEISPFKVSSHIPWYNKCTMKILKKESKKCLPCSNFFSDNR